MIPMPFEGGMPRNPKNGLMNYGHPLAFGGPSGSQKPFQPMPFGAPGFGGWPQPKQPQQPMPFGAPGMGGFGPQPKQPSDPRQGGFGQQGFGQQNPFQNAMMNFKGFGPIRPY